MRWAISYLIDRQQLMDVAYGGSSEIAQLPLPHYPGVQPFVDSVKDQLQQYNTSEYNPDKAGQLLQSKGYRMGDDGFWADANGHLKTEIGGWEIFDDLGPVMAEMLRKGGVDATYVHPPDMLDRFQTGDYQGMLSLNGGSINGDPYATCALFQTASVGVAGQNSKNQTKWQNANYDKIVDEMAVTPASDQAKLIDQFQRAMAIWLPELPNIPMYQWFHHATQHGLHAGRFDLADAACVAGGK
jgi:peptide/nickel transport system substrate-binding protein